ncbi:MAG: ABC transporter permease [Puia sp.]|nr:ABC transporter permease [Puia sp.]
MIKNYLKIAFRNLSRNKVYGFINIVGLATGMAAALLIGLWIWSEVSFDRYYKKHGRLAEIVSNVTMNGVTSSELDAAVPLANELRQRFPDDFKELALMASGNHMIAVGDKKMEQEGIWAEAGFPAMFTFNMLRGNQEALKDPSSAMISQSLAKELFGNEDPMGKTIRVDNTTDMKVTGIYEDLPSNSTFYGTEFLLAWENKDNPGRGSDGWTNHHYELFVELSDQAGSDQAVSGQAGFDQTGSGHSVLGPGSGLSGRGQSGFDQSGFDQSRFDQISAKIKDITKPHIRGGWEEIMLHPMDRWHLYNEFKNGKATGGRIQFVWLFGIAGFFILLLACINFTNLSTARSEKRAREVGIRKAIGSRRWQLIGQFLGESLLLASFALVLAFLMAWLFLPSFNRLAAKELTLPLGQGYFWLLVLGFTLFTGLLAGSYPAFYLSGFNTVKVLKGSFRLGRFAALPRKVLVTLQFTISIVLIVSTLIVFRQIQYAKDRPVGYSREGLITIDMTTPELKQHYDALRNELLQTGAVENVAESSSPSTEVQNSMLGYDWKGRAPGEIGIGTVFVGYDFGKTLGWEIKDGRDFSREYPSDSGAVILNEAAAKLVGFKQPVGESIRWHDQEHAIIGVVKNMVMESPYMPVQPTFFTLYDRSIHLITIRIKPGMAIRGGLAKIEQVFKRYNPGSSFEYRFTDEEYARKFFDEEHMGSLVTVFAVLAIFISCLGLFGLASFTAGQRSKEIGVRKILGASVFSLWTHLSREFVGLVLLSCLIAIPVSTYFLDQWLQKYDYRTTMSGWVFLGTGVGAVVIALLTVSYQTVKAALANPIGSLRTDG